MNRRWSGLLAAALLFLVILALYASTAARGIVPGDPTEYTFVAHLLGIAHPPGYAFMTLLTKTWQTLVPIGSIAQRSHLLAAAAGALTSALVFGIVWQVGKPQAPRRITTTLFPALLAGLSAATAADQWQHSIHINSHVITLTLNALALFFLVRWWRARLESEGHRPGVDRWLLLFCVVAGVGPTHHPLTVFSYPAYALFIILVEPGLVNLASGAWWREKRWRPLLAMLLCGLLGLAVWLYYPIRSPMRPAFGPADMNTLDGFMNVALARGLRVNLFHFGFAEQGQRLLVFWTLLRQQFSLPMIGLAAVGLGWVARRQPRLLALLGLALLVNLAFVINTVQDVMAYLLTPFMLVATMAGAGALGLIQRLEERLERWRPGGLGRWQSALWALLLVLPATNLATNVSRISLQDYRVGDEYVAAVFERFEGSDEGATLLNDWEHMTPLWYSQFVDQRWPDPADVTPSLVSTNRPWVERVFEHLPAGPVYLSGYRREVVEIGFQLRPEGAFYRVVEPGDESVPTAIQPLPPIPDQPIDLLGYWLPNTAFSAGDLVPLDLAMRTPITLTEYLVPYVQVGKMQYPFTTDSHLLSPLWRPGEVIVERFNLALPLDLPAGRYPMQVGLANLSSGADSRPVSLGDLTVTESPQALGADLLNDLLANFGQRVGINRVKVQTGTARRSAIWEDPLVVRPGDSMDITIRWRCLAPIEESFTVFVHLMDAGNRIWDQQDYTPLGGSNPTHLWIPKWLPGQTALDPYRLTMPEEAPPGDYYLEIGLYGMTTRQRVYQYDRNGNQVGDRLVLGPIRVP